MIPGGGAASSPARLLSCGLLCLTSACGGFASAGGAPSAVSDELEYRVYVANESSDLVSRVVFDRELGARVEREIPVGIMPADTDGPHGVAVSPDGAFLYVTVAHGTPDGWLWKFQAGPDTVVDRITLGRFPATLAATPDGQILVVANFNLHGEPVPSDLSVVYGPELAELARIGTCVTPHGSRIGVSGTFHYSACVRSDQIVETSLSSYRISQRYSVHPGAEGPLALEDDGVSVPAGPRCSPTWVTPGVGSRADRYLYVACNAAGQVLEVDASDWTVDRRFELGSGPYNMAATPDGNRLVVTLRGGQAVAFVDLESSAEPVVRSTSRSFTHGVVIRPDGRYAFVTSESAGSVRGTLDVFDLGSLEAIASVELQHQPGGIAFWRADPIGSDPPS
jgi:DNA-binding beta-propeller fold protein YncE